MTATIRAYHEVLAGSRRPGPGGQTTDVVITQAVEHQPGQLPCGGDHPDVAATTRADPVAVSPEQGMTGHALHSLDRGPAHQPGALFGDPAAVHRGVGLVMSRSQPSPGGQLLGSLEAGDVADLGDEHRGQDRPDTGNGLDRPVAGIGTQPARDQLGDRSISKSSAVMIRNNESTRERDSTASTAAASNCRPPGANRSVIGTCTPAPARTAWTWHLRLVRSPTSLARWRTQPRNSRVAGGAIHASGSLPMRSRSARSAASRSSFLTRRSENIFTPNGSHVPTSTWYWRESTAAATGPACWGE